MSNHQRNNMKKTILLTALTLACASAAQAQMSYDSSSSSYQGSSGTRYQYDLSKPADSGRYSIDTSAQMRDMRRLPSPGQIMDRSRGQIGGGILD